MDSFSLSFTDVLLFVSHPVPVEVTLGSMARFSCAVSGSPVLIRWELNQRSLPLDSDRCAINQQNNRIFLNINKKNNINSSLLTMIISIAGHFRYHLKFSKFPKKLTFCYHENGTLKPFTNSFLGISASNLEHNLVGHMALIPPI